VLLLNVARRPKVLATLPKVTASAPKFTASVQNLSAGVPEVVAAMPKLLAGVPLKRMRVREDGAGAFYSGLQMGATRAQEL
jgi:hypothetical protein